MEKKMFDQPLQLLFLDLEKTYDSVSLQNVRKAFKHYNLSNSIRPAAHERF
jgi:hypothetical protein